MNFWCASLWIGNGRFRGRIKLQAVLFQLKKRGEEMQNGHRWPEVVEYYDAHPLLARFPRIEIWAICWGEKCGHYGPLVLGYYCRRCEEPVIAKYRKPVVWERCPACGHETQLVDGHYCRCGFAGWSSCKCRSLVRPVLPPIPFSVGEPEECTHHAPAS
ncbi:MAG: hypothetical protein UY64_C0018G0001 [Parcubacteria group bacterium GW2011_GWA1_51_12]|nr:MAG: hypothetical protein UY64_C0018G0001 [Parcubacteria group bacterium GW2011_GWA1_51_12]